MGSTFCTFELMKNISSVALLQSFRSKMTTLFPLLSFVITIFLFLLRFRKTRC